MAANQTERTFPNYFKNLEEDVKKNKKNWKKKDLK